MFEAKSKAKNDYVTSLSTLSLFLYFFPEIMNDTFMNISFWNMSHQSQFQPQDYHSEFIEWITEGVLLIIISIFGFVGNALSIYVLLRPTVKGKKISKSA